MAFEEVSDLTAIQCAKATDLLLGGGRLHSLIDILRCGSLRTTPSDVLKEYGLEMKVPFLNPASINEVGG